MIFPRTNLRL